jgi:hypothetical protein
MSTRTHPPRATVDRPIVAVLTRFRFVHSWDVFRAYREFRRIRATAEQTPGYLHSAFLVENAHACMSLSVWERAEAIPHFGTISRDHVRAGTWAFGRLARTPGGGRELWSTRWQLSTVSNNLEWAEFDLGALLEQPAREGAA